MTVFAKVSLPECHRRQCVAEHQGGFGARQMARRLPIVLIYAEDYDRVEDAFLREEPFQGWNRAKHMALINGPEVQLPKLERKAFRSSGA